METRWKPNVTVAAIVRQDDRFLLVEEEKHGQQVFNQPAGHLEQGETFIDAIKREVLEESAWEFEPDAVTGIYLYPSPREDITYLRICFTGNCITLREGHELDEGIIRAVWMTRQEIENNKTRLRSPMVLRCIDDYLSGQRYPLELLHNYFSPDLNG